MIIPTNDNDNKHALAPKGGSRKDRGPPREGGGGEPSQVGRPPPQHVSMLIVTIIIITISMITMCIYIYIHIHIYIYIYT